MESQHAAQQEKLFHLIVSLGETSDEYVGSEATKQAHLTCEDICWERKQRPDYSLK